MQQQEKEEQYQILTSNREQLERGVESLRNELEAERLSKERELRKMTTKREMEVAKHKNELASIKQKLVAEEQKSSFVVEVTLSLIFLYVRTVLLPLFMCTIAPHTPIQEQCNSQCPETLHSLRQFSTVSIEHTVAYIHLEISSWNLLWLLMLVYL